MPITVEKGIKNPCALCGGETARTSKDGVSNAWCCEPCGVTLDVRAGGYYCYSCHEYIHESDPKYHDTESGCHYHIRCAKQVLAYHAMALLGLLRDLFYTQPGEEGWISSKVFHALEHLLKPWIAGVEPVGSGKGYWLEKVMAAQSALVDANTYLVKRGEVREK